MDTVFTNGNYYLGDIIEIALLAEESGSTFRSYVKIHYSIPRRVQQLTHITNKSLKSIGISFIAMVDALVDFLCREQRQSETSPIIIAHGGFLNDFPILPANYIKYSYDNYLILENCMYVGSMLIFRNAGYAKPGLDALCQEFNIAMEAIDYYPALHDAELLMALCKKGMDLLLKLDHLHIFTLMVFCCT